MHFKLVIVPHSLLIYFHNHMVAKRKACLQPEKTHGYQYLFAVQFFNIYAYRGQVNKGHLRGLDKVFRNRNRHHQIRHC